MLTTDRPTVARFRFDVKEHQMEIIRDDGLSRHIRFKKSSTTTNYFDLITWGGHLCISGDMGTYVFSRIQDMFEFFRSNDGKLKINTGYWAEKVDAEDRRCGITRYSPEKFKKQVKSWLAMGEASKSARKAAETEVLNRADDGEFWAMQAAIDFNHEGFRLSDFWEANLHEYTYQFVWCCYAIVYGIQKYDKVKNEAK